MMIVSVFPQVLAERSTGPFKIADDITVIRDGALIATHPASELDVTVQRALSPLVRICLSFRFFSKLSDLKDFNAQTVNKTQISLKNSLYLQGSKAL